MKISPATIKSIEEIFEDAWELMYECTLISDDPNSPDEWSISSKNAVKLADLLDDLITYTLPIIRNHKEQNNKTEGKEPDLPIYVGVEL